MLADSNFLTALEHNAVSPTGQQMCIYGDLAYPLRINLMAPFRGAALTAQMEALNDSMSNVRTWVEWLFGDIVEYFKFMDFKKNLKIGLSSIGKLYVVCALLRNALTCLYGNSTSSFFELDPPTLEEYFSWTILSHLSTNCWPKIELWNQLKVVKQRFDNSSIFCEDKGIKHFINSHILFKHNLNRINKAAEITR